MSGEFEIHVTVLHGADGLETFARQHGVKYTHIVLDRGSCRSQPMLTIPVRGTLAEVRELVAVWQQRLRDARLYATRVKIEAAPGNAGVPAADQEALAQPTDRYFEHHAKLLLPDVSVRRLVELARLVKPHQAHLSRNARRVRADGAQERFVTQRCHRVGRDTARQRLDRLLGDLRSSGYSIVEVEQEYVVHDTGIHLDSGWLHPQGRADDSIRAVLDRQAPAGTPGYPATYQPIPPEDGVWQRGAFDPALKQFGYAYRAGEPEFTDPGTGRAWRGARLAAMHHLLGLVAAAPWADHLVLRGSLPLRAWLGEAAREPGDLDFVVVPHTVTVSSPEAATVLDGLVEAVRRHPGAGLHADRVAVEDIWTYERASGRRLVFPLTATGLPPGAVQVDLVFNEKLPLPPEPVRIPPSDVEIATATPELALAWKLLWLATDMWPQGKDLYDAALLAEYVAVPLELVRDLLRPELGQEADSFTAATVLGWNVDWDNFRDEYPAVKDNAEHWQHRLALALAPAFGE